MINEQTRNEKVAFAITAIVALIIGLAAGYAIAGFQVAGSLLPSIGPLATGVNDLAQGYQYQLRQETLCMEMLNVTQAVQLNEAMR